jgi:hypothetical protein
MENCQCRTCIRERDDGKGFISLEFSQMILCSICGNKRCPHANDHKNECTNSNDVGQLGSYY